ncbi:MAG: hypothetical protein E7587_06030 [Ruminococcaceae bacterium]|nr:hypothetical protein [Oscillospiraceae bacterium]
MKHAHEKRSRNFVAMKRFGYEALLRNTKNEKCALCAYDGNHYFAPRRTSLSLAATTSIPSVFFLSAL